MDLMRVLTICAAAVTLAVTGSFAPAGIILDYSHDSFFASNATAKAALEAAAADVSSVLNYAGAALTGADDMIDGVNGSTTVTYDFDVNYTNPTTGAPVTLSSVGDLSGGGLGVGEIRVFVGVRQLTGTTLGQGGPGVLGLAAGATGVLPELPGAVTAANASASATYGRGDGPTIGNLTGDLAGSTVDVDFGSTVGNLWFDSDTNNDTIEDFDAWHFDHTLAVAAGKNDFYSVALHEIIHAVGYGTSDSWDALVSGTDWLGPNAIALMGSGVGLISGDGAHIASGVMSSSLFDGSSQESLLSPSIVTGTRKYITALDVAVLQDIGFANASAPAAIPEPGSLAFCAVGSLLLIGRHRRRRRSAAASDASQAA